MLAKMKGSEGGRYKAKNKQKGENTPARFAFVASLPVLVLMKSAPACMHTTEALRTSLRVGSSPVARIVFMWACPQAETENEDMNYHGIEWKSAEGCVF